VPDRLVIGGQKRVRSARAIQQGVQRPMRFGIGGIERDGAPPGIDRLLRPALQIQRLAKMMRDLGLPGCRPCAILRRGP
jgi:hypothetical protein